MPVPLDAKAYLDDRLARLRQLLDEVNRLAAAGELADVQLNDKGLKISPIVDDTPSEAKALVAQIAAMLPPVKITHLLVEVVGWIDFARQFTHLKTGEPSKDRKLLLTALLADAFNLGIEKMAQACPGITPARLAYHAAWHVRTDTYSKALAELVNFHHKLPFSAHWGDGTTSSSDGQRFNAGSHAEQSGYRNAKYGDDPGVLFYTHVSNQYAGYHIKVINGPVRNATHVLDGLLYHESDLKIEEHYTDTAGFTDHVFAMCHLHGFTFAPRIADLADKRLYVPGKLSDWPALSSIVGGSLDTKAIEASFEDILRMTVSTEQGTVTVSLLLRKLAAYPKQNRNAVGLREMGRIERSVHMLTLLRDPPFRRRVTAGLNKGESRHKLARGVLPPPRRGARPRLRRSTASCERAELGHASHRGVEHGLHRPGRPGTAQTPQHRRRAFVAHLAAGLGAHHSDRRLRLGRGQAVQAGRIQSAPGGGTAPAGAVGIQ